MIYDVVDSKGKIVVSGFSSRKEAKNSRAADQFVIRNSSHPMGRSNFSAMKAKTREIQEKNEKGEMIKRIVRTQ